MGKQLDNAKIYTVEWEEKNLHEGSRYRKYNEKTGDQFFNKEQALNRINKLKSDKNVRKNSIKYHEDDYIPYDYEP